jgi:alcohol dehydrogenase
MKIQAAVLRESGLPSPFAHSRPLGIESVDLDPPGPGEVLVRVRAAGLCHSDLSVIDGNRPRPLPMVLGHEVAGVVEDVGAGVDDLQRGDHVVAAFVPSCGHCEPCSRGRPALCEPGLASNTDGTLLSGARRLHQGEATVHHHLGVSGFAEWATLSRRSLVLIDDSVPLDKAALVGCAVMTGVGAAINTAKVEPGSSVAVFGAGGIGLNVIQGAALAGASTIIAVDMADKKLEMAQQFGATHVVNPSSDGDAVQKIIALSGGGADYAFEAIGLPATIQQTYAWLRKGGTAVVVGVAKMMDQVQLGAFMMPFQEKVLTGSMYGSARPSTDFPRLLDLYKAHRLKLDELVTATYKIEDINRAFDDMQHGVNARGVILF